MSGEQVWFDLVGRIQNDVEREIETCQFLDYGREVSLRSLDTHLIHAKTVLQELIQEKKRAEKVAGGTIDDKIS